MRNAILLAVLAFPLAAQVRVWEGTLTLPTYQEGLPDVNPPFDLFATTRFNYPYTIRDKLTGQKVEQKWRALFLENEYLKCSVLPDIGGHLYSCTDKVNGAEMFYANPTIKKALIGYRGAWAAFGIEFNFPVSHNWVSMSPVDFATVQHPDGSASVWVANIDRAYGMQWRVELKLRPASNLLEQAVRLYNRSDVRHRFYWWNNAAVEVWDDTRVLYPMRFSASHGFTYVDTWPVNHAGLDLSVVANQTGGTVSEFIHASREPFMGLYHPRTRAGLVHYAEWRELPAKKIWTWGSDAEGREWRRVLSDNNSAYAEVQAGLFRNQETYAFLPPQETIEFREYWLPVRDTGGFVRANLNGAVNMERSGGDVLVALNVTRAVKGSLRVGAVEEIVSLTPRDTWRKTMSCPSPCTFELRDGSGAVVLAHTEGRFDQDPPSEVKTGPQPAPKFDTPLALGTDQELNGKVLQAYETYTRALKKSPADFELNKAAGRLAVALHRYDEGLPLLTKASAMVTNDPEIHYYLGLAWNALGNPVKARAEWSRASTFRALRSAALLQLAGLEAREGKTAAALADLAAANREFPGMVRAGALEIALLRHAGSGAAARDRLKQWLAVDPTNSMLRYEGIRLDTPDGRLWEHLAAEPDRVLELATDYIHVGLYQDALELLSRQYPKFDPATGEPGTVVPQQHPLVVYYRGWCREKLGHSGRGDFEEAAMLSTRYVFPQRAGTYPVLKKALEVNPKDAVAHFLLGSLYAQSGAVDPAMREWEAARSIKKDIPVLHRNLGYVLLETRNDPARALEVLKEGAGVDRANLDIYSGMYRALLLLDRPARERVDALRLYPEPATMPARLVYRLALALIEDNRAGEAAQLFEGRFFPREEGGLDPRQIHLEARLQDALATKRSPGIADDALTESARFQYYLGEAEAQAGNREAAAKHWKRATELGRRGDQIAFAYRAAQKLGQTAGWQARLESALKTARNDYARGLLQAALGRKTEAEALFRKTIRSQDNIVNWYLARQALAGK